MWSSRVISVRRSTLKTSMSGWFICQVRRVIGLNPSWSACFCAFDGLWTFAGWGRMLNSYMMVMVSITDKYQCTGKDKLTFLFFIIWHDEGWRIDNSYVNIDMQNATRKLHYVRNQTQLCHSSSPLRDSLVGTPYTCAITPVGRSIHAWTV